MVTEQCATTDKIISISFFRFSYVGEGGKEIQLPSHVGILFRSIGKFKTFALPGNARGIVELYQEKFRQTTKFVSTDELLASINVQNEKEILDCSGAYGDIARTALLEGRFTDIFKT